MVRKGYGDQTFFKYPLFRWIILIIKKFQKYQIDGNDEWTIHHNECIILIYYSS